MPIVVTGGAGFLGARLIRALLAADDLIDDEAAKPIVSLDRAVCPIEDERVESRLGDISDPALIKSTLGKDTTAVCHLAAIVSAQAEADFDLGMRVNLDGTRALLDAARALPRPPRFLFASSLAVFGPDLAQPVAADVAPRPRSSYGIQKTIGELLVNDYTRRGFVDGRACRLPTVVVRPGKPNRAASSFASSIIREPLAGLDAVCPVAPGLSMWLSSPRAVVANLVHALRLPAARLGSWRTINLPGVSVTVEAMLEALARRAGPEARRRVRFEPDEAIAAVVRSWPAALDVARPLDLGFVADRDFDAVLRAYLEDYGQR